MWSHCPCWYRMTPQHQLPLPSGRWWLPRPPWGSVSALLWSSESSGERSSQFVPTECHPHNVDIMLGAKARVLIRRPVAARLTLPDCSSGKVPDSTAVRFGARFLAVMLSKACNGHNEVRFRAWPTKLPGGQCGLQGTRNISLPCHLAGCCWKACSSWCHTQP